MKHLTPLALLLALASAPRPARADVPADPCAGKQQGDPCLYVESEGTCQPGTKCMPSPCLECVPLGTGGSSSSGSTSSSSGAASSSSSSGATESGSGGCAMATEPGAKGVTMAALAALALASLRRRKRG